MRNFKEIVEKCLAGELSGIFILRNGDKCKSINFKKDKSILTSFRYLEDFYYSNNGYCYLFTGRKSEFDIVDFIPDNMQEQIKIDILEGKVPIIEQTDNGVVINWKDKELIYDDIESKLNCRISSCGFLPNKINFTFYKKVEVLRKLTNIRNYFGGDKPTNMWTLTRDSALRVFPMLCRYRETCHIYFDTKEHAEQAIKMLGDELKYLFEPW